MSPLLTLVAYHADIADFSSLPSPSHPPNVLQGHFSRALYPQIQRYALGWSPYLRRGSAHHRAHTFPKRKGSRLIDGLFAKRACEA